MFQLSVQDSSQPQSHAYARHITLASQSLEPVIDQMKIHRVYSGYTFLAQQTNRARPKSKGPNLVPEASTR